MANGHTNSKTKAANCSRRKLKRTFSLSVKAVAYIDALAKQHRSASEALEQLIQEQKSFAEKVRVSDGIRSYYDTISESERAEKLAWAELAATHFLKG